MFKPGSYQNLGRARDFLQFWINSCDDRICARKGLIGLRPQPSNSITKSYDSIYHKQRTTSNKIFFFLFGTVFWLVLRGGGPLRQNRNIFSQILFLTLSYLSEFRNRLFTTCYSQPRKHAKDRTRQIHFRISYYNGSWMKTLEK